MGGGQNNTLPPPPIDVHVIIPRTYEYVTLWGRMDFADVTELRILRWDGDPGGPGVITRVLVRGTLVCWRQREIWRWDAAGFEDSGRGHGPRSVGGL